MDTLHVRWKPVGIVAGILVVVAGLIYVIVVLAAPAEPSQNAANTAGASSTVTTVANGTPDGSSTASAPPTTAGGGSGTQNIPPLPGSTITIHLLTPIANNVWTIGQANPIAWDNAADVTGEIDLVNAVTKQFIGVILSETGPKQTSYTWNAEQVYLGRYSANEVAVEPGVYSISIRFDGNGLGELISGPITITK